MASWHNTTGYRPDPVLAKQMAGGGFGGLMSNLGGAFDKLYQTSNANDQWKAEQKIREMNASIGKSNADANAQHAKLGQLKYDNELENNSRATYDSLVKNNQTLNTHGDRTHGYGAAMPSYDEYKALPEDGRTTFASQFGALTQGVNSRMATEATEKERTNKLADERMKQMYKLQEIDHRNNSKGTPLGDTKLVVPFGGGQPFNGAIDPKTGTWFNVDTGEHVSGPVQELDEGKQLANETKRVENDDLINQRVEKAFNSFGKSWNSIGAFDWFYNDESERKNEARKNAYWMINNGESRGVSDVDLIKEAYSRAGAPVGVFGPKASKEDQNTRYVNSVIGGSDPTKITPDVIKQFLRLEGENSSDDAVNAMLPIFQMIAKEKAQNQKDINSFNDKLGLDQQFLSRTYDNLRDAKNNATSTLGNLGVLSEASDINMDGLGHLGIVPERSSESFKKANETKYANENYAVANEQMDWAPIASELIKYSPTVALNPAAMTGRLANIAANGLKFGTADAALAYLYDDNVPMTGTAGFLAGNLVGTFSRLGLKVEKGSKAEALFMKTMEETHNKGDALYKPSYQRK